MIDALYAFLGYAILYRANYIRLNLKEYKLYESYEFISIKKTLERVHCPSSKVSEFYKSRIPKCHPVGYDPGNPGHLP